MGAIIHTKSNAAGFQGNQGQGVGAGRQPQRVDDRAKKKINSTNINLSLGTNLVHTRG